MKGSFERGDNQEEEAGGWGRGGGGGGGGCCRGACRKGGIRKSLSCTDPARAKPEAVQQ